MLENFIVGDEAALLALEMSFVRLCLNEVGLLPPLPADLTSTFLEASTFLRGAFFATTLSYLFLGNFFAIFFFATFFLATFFTTFFAFFFACFSYVNSSSTYAIKIIIVIK